MDVVGLIAEYNPFHNGHLYHLNKSKSITKSNYSIAVMSGNFLQRGEPALLDKWSRAKMAVDSGVDLVLELPFIYASRSAEYFSDGAVKTLDALGVVDSLCFGSEEGNVLNLKNIADVLVLEPEDFKLSLKKHLDLGESFPKARALSLIEYFQNNKLGFNKPEEIEDIVSSPNNILAIEYMKSLKKINSKIKPFTIKRTSNNYHDKSISGNISSATSIRVDYFLNKNLDKILNVVPNPTLKYMDEFLKSHNNFNSLEHFEEILLYIFRFINYDKLSNIIDVDEGLQNRIIKAFSSSNDLEEIMKNIKTKRYPETRIKRILVHALMDLSKETFKRLDIEGPRYIRVLGANKSGLELLSEIKLKSKLPIITKFSNYHKLNDKVLNEMIELDKEASDLYFTGLNKFTKKPNMNLDFLTSPYIKK